MNMIDTPRTAKESYVEDGEDQFLVVRADFASELERENARLQAGWQQIETAPKDGTLIDVCAEYEGEHETKRIRLTNISWHSANEIFPHTGWIRITDDGNWDLLDSQPTCPLGLPQWTPTHWMPLPALPNVQAQR